MGALRRVGRVVNYGDSIHDREWELLVILDACRTDAIREVESEYEFLDSGWMYSNASTSHEWVDKNLSGGSTTEDVVYVTANPNAERLDPDALAGIERVWEYGYDDELEVTPPRAVTDAAIRSHRDAPDRRMVVHYMQPHSPLLGLDHPPSVWKALRDDELEWRETWPAYLDTLRWALDEVEALLENVNAAPAVITADHAELMGEWNLYGHGEYIPAPALKRVPWIMTEATDRHTRQPPDVTEREVPSRETQLRDLGYL